MVITYDYREVRRDDWRYVFVITQADGRETFSDSLDEELTEEYLRQKAAREQQMRVAAE